MEEIVVQSATESYTHHRATSSNANPAAFTSEAYLETVGDVLAQMDSTSCCTSSDFGPETSSFIPVKESTAVELDTTINIGTAGTSATRSLFEAPIPATFRLSMLTEASADSPPTSCHEAGNEADTAAPQATGNYAHLTPETTLDTHSGAITSPSGREQQNIPPRVSLRGSLPAWLECCRSRSASNGRTQEGFDPVVIAPGISDSTMQSTGGDPTSPASASSATTPSRESGYSVTPGIDRLVLGPTIPGKTTVPSVEEPKINSGGEAEPEAIAEPSSTSCMSSLAPQSVVGFDNTALISLTAPPSPAPSTPVLRRSRRGTAPIGGYAEVDSDTESNASGSPTASSGDDRPFGRRSSPLGSLGQPGNKRRRACSHEEFASGIRASKRSRGSQETSTQALTTRRSRRVAEPMKQTDVINLTQSESASGEGQNTDHVLATFDEFPLHFAPLTNFVLKRTVVGHVTTFTIEWQQVNPPHYRCQAPPKVIQSPPSPSLSGSDLAQFPRGHRRAFSKDEDRLLCKLKREGKLRWKEIHRQFSNKFPGRTIGTLRVRYSTKLKH
ncbi:hypothetical protein CTAM01_11606 [Colletotrichum tamarilloi]|uniref:Myb-like domain-containing protein n=1 Tax=Colletotrichum tamarilloi TaxID=1209934 RepID=A0ABQ9QX84_9PEZI|nr:uncharacterized protein CTAM01_11606 [Colletotrichum tamarilloi]KAK1488060.1 hypothetical protein CTAM01_11606 [Colletotrichum tamarilloi]